MSAKLTPTSEKQKAVSVAWRATHPERAKEIAHNSYLKLKGTAKRKKQTQEATARYNLKHPKAPKKPRLTPEEIMQHRRDSQNKYQKTEKFKKRNNAHIRDRRKNDKVFRDRKNASKKKLYDAMSPREKQVCNDKKRAYCLKKRICFLKQEIQRLEDATLHPYYLETVKNELKKAIDRLEALKVV